MFHDESQLGSLISIPEILQALKESAPIEPTDEIKAKLKQIIDICNSDYFERHKNGHAAINRSILLDAEIAKLLTPDVIKYICTSEKKISVTTDLRVSEEKAALFDILNYGLADLVAIKYMINAKTKYDADDYINQKKQFDQTTVEIVKNIYFAAGREFSSVIFEQHTSIHSSSLDVANLSTWLDDIIKRVITLKEGGQTEKLLEFKTYYDNVNDKIRRDISAGFSRICETMGMPPFIIPFNKMEVPVSLASFCNDFLLDKQNIILDGTISSLFHDRIHILGALELDTKLAFTDGQYTFRELFTKMIQLLASSPSNYPPSTLEQFYVRLKMVKDDLIKRFGPNPQDSVEMMKEKSNQTSFPPIICEGPTINLTEFAGVQNPIINVSNSPFTTFKPYDNTAEKKFLKHIAHEYNNKYNCGATHIVVKIKNYKEEKQGNTDEQRLQIEAHNKTQPIQWVQFKFISEAIGMNFIKDISEKHLKGGYGGVAAKDISSGHGHYSKALQKKEYFVKVNPDILRNLHQLQEQNKMTSRINHS